MICIIMARHSQNMWIKYVAVMIMMVSPLAIGAAMAQINSYGDTGGW